jgi:hypothetical protein
MSSKARTSKILFVLLLLLMTACTQQPTVIVPTLAVLPSPTPTDTPSNTPTATATLLPTATPTATDTPTPSDTPTELPSLTLTASQTLTPSLTNTASLTPSDTPTKTLTPTRTNTSTLTFTPSQTSTPTPSDTPSQTPTSTPTFTATIQGPTIISFGANMTSVIANTSITLAWVAQADGARLETLTSQGAVLQSFPVLPAGQFTVAVPGNLGRTVSYRFVAIRNGVEDSRTIVVGVACQFSWFFGDQYAPQNAACATTPITADGRYQAFENGLMLYVSANGLNHVYGLQNANSLYIGYTNAWDASTLNNAAAPSGRFTPQEMFNWAYYNTLAPIGSWNSAIGWATANIVNAPRTIQWETAVGGGNPFYIDGPDGGVYRFSGGENGSWSRLR